jgi:molecular chaperone HtpG
MTAETMEFRTELKQLLHLIVHSLYSHKDIFLRELISNASDAIDRVRFQGLTNAELLEGNEDWKIKLIPDENAGTLTISDNGIGLSRATVVEQLGTIARSGTREFLESLRLADAKDRPELIGQFGVGFYSAFMVADKVTVLSRTAGKPEDGVKWESDGQGSFTVELHTRATRGTDVILHLKADDKEYLQAWRLRQLVKKYSDFVEHPIVIDVEKEEDGAKKTVEETLNARKAIWLRNRSQVTEEEYHEFYKQLAHDTQNPLRTIHYNAEGQVEFKALLYLPAHRPFDLVWGDSNKGLHLYIQRVFILDDAETLLPRYLRFVRGVVDSPDLPLNVSREILQHSAPLEKIRSNLVNKVLSTLDEVRRKDFDQYVGFYRDLGSFIKEGAYQDYAHKQRLADLLLFESTKTDPGKQTALGDYVDRMPGEQTEIYYLTGESRQLLEASPHLEAYRAKGWEVLLLIDAADEIVIDSLHEYKGKHLKAVDRGSADASGISEERQAEFRPFLEYLKSKLPDVKEARLTSRLKESAVCLVSDEGAYSAHVERFMQRLHRDQAHPESQRILEVNPDHPVVRAVQVLHSKDAADARLEKYAWLLYDEALITEGSKVRDPQTFARRLNELLLAACGAA